MTNITLIAALSNNGTIGVDGQLPWRIKEDLYHFYNYTIHKPVVMGRKTFESIGKALNGRVNIVLTTQAHYKAAGCLVAHDIEQVLAMVQNEPETVVIGGREVYAAFLPFATRLVLTHVLDDVEGDTHFPAVNGEEWEFVGGHYYHEEPAFGHCFAIATYERVVQPAQAPSPYPAWFPECPYPADIFTMTAEGYTAALPDGNVRSGVSGYLGRLFWNITQRNMAQSLGERVEDMLGWIEEGDEEWYMGLTIAEQERVKNIVREWLLGTAD